VRRDLDSTVLIVDDTESGREILESVLLGQGYNLLFASDGYGALELAAAHNPDVILLDVMMPGLSGFDVCKRLRADPALAEVPVVLVTALDDADSRIQGIEAGADDFLSKPIDRREVRARVRTICRLNRYRKLSSTTERYQSLLQLAPEGVVILNAQGNIQLANDRAQRLLGDDALLGKALVDFFANDSAGPAPNWPVNLFSTGGENHFQTIVTRPDGGRRHIGVAAGPLSRSAHPQIQVTLTDLSAERAAETKAKRALLFDSLTGLPNRTLLLDRMGQWVLRDAAVDTNASPEYSAMLVIHIDHFGRMNDAFGRDAGDLTLVTCARRLQALAGTNTTVARVSPDGFAILAPPETSSADLAALADRVLELLAKPIKVAGGQLQISASIGGVRTCFGAEPRQSDSTAGVDDRVLRMLRSGEVAVRQAKAQGRARYSVFDPTRQDDAARFLRLQHDIRGAAARSELYLLYQPILDLAEEKLVGFEALARWKHPEFGQVFPDEFIPLAEQTGAILDLGTWALNEACRQLMAWRREGVSGHDISMAVNVSPLQVANGTLIADVQRALAQSGLPAANLKLELTESAMLHDGEATTALFSGLQKLGVRVNLDDFGTGYSSFSQIALLPLDALKVDRSFITQMRPGNRFEKVVLSIIRLADALDLDIIIEGVETEDQRDILRSMNAGYVQGYLYARPLPADVAAGFRAPT
jgi:diguanylate cyclase (GGDEF)-like protein/PAS domain S-box-containing protein